MIRRDTMRWDCEIRGCFNLKKRLKFQVFSRAFPGLINFTDVDGLVEYNGNALMLEWKSAPVALSRGQEIMGKRLSKGKRFTIFYVAGDAETMEVFSRACFFDGRWYSWRGADLSDLNLAIEHWCAWSRAHPCFGGR